jgi:hypothetical protein
MASGDLYSAVLVYLCCNSILQTLEKYIYMDAV